MSSLPDDELQALRARAYGPTADTDLDAASALRLRELEDQHARRHGASAGGAQLEPSDDDGDDERAGLFPTVEDVAPASRQRLSRRTKALWIGSVAAAAALAACITVAVGGIGAVSASSGVPQIATLESTRTVTSPTGWLTVDEVSLVFEFHDATLITFTLGEAEFAIPDAGPACMILVDTEQVPAADEFNSEPSWNSSGPFYHAGCAVGRFPATIEPPLSDDVPEELRAAFPDARALQFVLDGDRVRVFLDDGD